MATDSLERTTHHDVHGNGRDGVRTVYQTLLGRLGWPGNGSAHALRTMGVTSCYPGEGVSTIAAQLALTAASCGDYRILLVDSNTAAPSVHQTFGVDAVPGLADVLLGGTPLAGCVRPSPAENLFLLPAGETGERPSAVEDSAGLVQAVKALKKDFDLVLFDMPAVGQADSAIRLAGLLDGVLLVVEAERVRWEVARRMQELLSRADARLVGAVLNKRRQHVPDWLYRTL